MQSGVQVGGRGDFGVKQGQEKKKIFRIGAVSMNLI